MEVISFLKSVMAKGLLGIGLRTKRIYDGVNRDGQIATMQDLAPPHNISLPSRWTIGSNTHAENIAELGRLATVLAKAAEAISGVYMRMCDTIRNGGLDDWEVRQALKPHFSEARISELLRVARAPEEVYKRYSGGFFGFKAALRECRLYNITPGEELKRRAVRRAAHRLVSLLQAGAVLRIKDRTITVT